MAPRLRHHKQNNAQSPAVVLERFRFRRNHTEENALRCTSSTGSVKVGIALVSAAGDPGSVAVAIEVPHGPVVDALLDRGFAVYAINPKQLDRLRDRISVAGAKDDRRDARVAAAGLRTDRHLFRRVLAGDPSVIELREWSRLAEELQQERTRLSNRIRQQLWRYDPQLPELSDDMTAEWVLALWTLAPTPAQAARLREATLARRLRQPRIRKLDAPAVLDILRQPAITVAPGVTEAAVLHLRSRVARLRLANQEFHQAARKLEELCTALSETDSAAQDGGPGDAAILRSLPGVGPVTLATLLTEAAGPLARRDYAALRTLSGVAPVTKRSGKTWVVVMRYAAQVRLRNAVFHWARVAVLNDPTCGSRYAALRARGHSYGRALRGVADRLLGVACVLLQRGMLFDPDYWGSFAEVMVRQLPRRLRRSLGSPLAPDLAGGRALCASVGQEATSGTGRLAPARSLLGHGATLAREDKTHHVGCLTAGRKSHQALLPLRESSHGHHAEPRHDGRPRQLPPRDPDRAGQACAAPDQSLPE